ncbi:hypothetical protein KUTeg_014746 [Tegillarca granosa]|uniref:Fibronectin type-III domain-containing protein n=1 Tax=Tegillarca granosa TaxID=220873 RepID=A0ABQ9ETM7_TEGGR|nr:hypothetical protein KUTeg_014746 [Tegillarca granosa]
MQQRMLPMFCLLVMLLMVFPQITHIMDGINTLVRAYTDFTGMLSESNRKITIPKVTFKDTGRYYCDVENGMKGRQPAIYQRGSSYFDVRASAKFDPKEEARKPGELHKNRTINITFYSNPPALIKDIKWINKTSGNPLKNSDNISLKLTSTFMQILVYGKTLTLTGQSAILIITSLKSFHLGNYQLQIENGGDLSSSFDFHFITSAPPETPSEFALAENGMKSVKVTWKRGYNGGHEQTFVIRYTNTVTQETKETAIEDRNQSSNYTVEIDELEPDTTYNFRIYSKNEKGNSTLSDSLFVQALKESEPKSQTSKIGAIVGGITGILTAIIIIVVVILGVLFYRQRTKRTTNTSDKMDGGGANDAYEDLDSRIALSDVSTYQKIRTTMISICTKGLTKHKNQTQIHMKQ